MGKRRNLLELGAILLLLLIQVVCLVAAKGTNSSSTWKTLSGNKPAIIARGGFSGTFPDSSSDAYSFALTASSSDTILYCDLQLTKDSVAICLPSIKLDNSTDIANIYPKGSKTYELNGVETAGWFSIDYTNKQLGQVTLQQPIWSRTEKFDYSGLPILSVNDLVSQLKPPSLWINVQHNIFFTQHNLSTRTSIINLSKTIEITYISSPEVSFLKSIKSRLPNSTSLIFRFLSPSSLIEPSLNISYQSLLQNLTFIKSFANGILVPKTYIWPVGDDNYLTEYTGLVGKAHQEGLEIHSADFANDNLFSYNYSYDPIEEILGFVDNGDFSVDGVLSDYPITPSQAIGCFTNLNKTTNDHGKPLIISHNGASGDFPDCTDISYQKAVDFGADIIDCTIQVTKDGTLICMSDISLIGITNVLQSEFSSLTSNVPELQSTPGIFVFNLTWSDISKNLEPVISQPESLYNNLKRNPRYANAGNFMKLSDFLDFAKDKDLDGILLSLENVAFVNQELGFDILSSVKTALNEAGYTNSTSLKVYIQSTDSSVLTKLSSQNPNKYSFIYKITEVIRDASQGSISDIKKFADAVAIDKSSIFPSDQAFITNMSDTVSRFQKAGLKVYAFTFMNEFVSQNWDFFSDATVEINTFVQSAKIDGIITDFPKTARRYKRSSCLLGNDAPNYAQPVQVGGLLELIVAPAQPPVMAPYPVLLPSDVSEPALPPVSANKNTTNNASGPSSQKPSHAERNEEKKSVLVMVLLGVLAMVFL